MIFLGPWFESLQETLLANFKSFNQNGSLPLIDFQFFDFDQVGYHVTGEKCEINIDVTMSFYSHLNKFGAIEILKNLYGDVLKDQPNPNCSATLKIDLKELPEDLGAFATKIASFKRNCYSAFFEYFFKAQAEGSTSDKCVIPIRDVETMYVQSLPDRVTVIFSTKFKDHADLLLSRVFLQEFTEVRRKLDRAPQVLYSQRDPPVELAATPALTGDDVTYFTMVLFPRHFSNINKNKSIDLIHTLRNYLHYHIKCSKAYVQMRMRAKTSDFLKILERARAEEPKNAIVRVLVDSATGDSSHTSTSYS